jgi:hypothetical protein
LTAAEKSDFLDHLVAAMPELREQAEAYAVRRMSDEDRDAVAAMSNPRCAFWASRS